MNSFLVTSLAKSIFLSFNFEKRLLALLTRGGRIFYQKLGSFMSSLVSESLEAKADFYMVYVPLITLYLITRDLVSNICSMSFSMKVFTSSGLSSRSPYAPRFNKSSISTLLSGLKAFELI